MNARRTLRFGWPWLALLAAALSVPASGAGPADAGARERGDVDVHSQRLLPQGQDQPSNVHRLRISRQRPPCEHPPGLPIVPNDPAALPGAPGVRCLGTRPPELELWLAEDRYLWLERSAPNPAAWIDLGPVELDARALTPAPLGLMLTADGAGWFLETRSGDVATLTPLAPGEWREVTAPDGRRFWVRIDGGGAGREPPGRGTIRYRAD